MMNYVKIIMSDTGAVNNADLTDVDLNLDILLFVFKLIFKFVQINFSQKEYC